MKGRKQCDPVNGCGKFYKQHLIECPSCKTPDMFSNFVPYNPLDWTYDEETYPNIFTADFKHVATSTRLLFEISDRKNQLHELYAFLITLKQTGCRLVGFNNIGFDYPILHFIIEHFHIGPSVTDIYNKSQAIINTPWENRFDNVIWDNDVHIQQIDLFKVHHFDNEARRTSLKMLEFNMRMDSIEDLPYPPGTVLNDLQKDVLIGYNDHDVDATEDFYIESIELIEFREELSKKYERNFMNHNDTKIGKDYFIMELEKALPGSCYSRDTGRKLPRQTIRPFINLGDVIFPYINFKVPEFERVKNWLASQVIEKTKGVFEYLTVTPEMAMSMRPNLIKVYGLSRSDVPSIPENKNLNNGIYLADCKNDLLKLPIMRLNNFKFVSGWKDQSGLNCIVNGFAYDFGTGGIHGSIDSTIVYSDDDYVIYDWDVASYYPNLAIANRLYPEHLSEQFCTIYQDVFEQRRQYKKGTPENAMLKLALNGVYGDSNNKYSPFYDPQYTMAITINGQLLLCMLAQHLIDIPGLEMIQINTDGLTVRCPRSYVDAMKNICKWWEDYTCLELESAVYSRMFIRDVNNYIAEYEGGELKRKGAYEYKRGWEKNHSSFVIAKAAEAALVHGQDIGDFIRNHNDIFDFMLRTKVGRSDKLVMKNVFGNEKELQKITRYYISNSVDAGALTKISPPAKGYTVGSWKRTTKLSDQFYNSVISELHHADAGGCFDDLPERELDANGLPWDERINTKNRSKYEIRRTDINAGYLVTPCNNIKDADRSNINFDYYIAEAEKLVKPLKGE